MTCNAIRSSEHTSQNDLFSDLLFKCLDGSILFLIPRLNLLKVRRHEIFNLIIFAILAYSRSLSFAQNGLQGQNTGKYNWAIMEGRISMRILDISRKPPSKLRMRVLNLYIRSFGSGSGPGPGPRLVFLP